MLEKRNFRIGLIGLLVTGMLSLQFCLSPEQKSAPEDTSSMPSASPTPPYNFDKPDQTMQLSNALREISGLATWSENRIVATQDEKGKIYWIDLKDGKVDQEVKYGKDGDYEGIATYNGKVYSMRSDGTLFRIKDLDAEEPKTKKYELDLPKNIDLEGLCYDPQSKQLLLAVKDDPDAKKSKRAIYAFDLESKSLKKEPAFELNLKELGAMLGEERAKFGPSGIAIHPITQDIYIVGSVGKLLVVVNREGQILSATRLDPERFRQPEGITFLPNGDLLISNEARYKGMNATLYRFNYQQ